MGWLYTHGQRLRELIQDRTKGWSRQLNDGVIVQSTCLASCFRGNICYQGTLWTVWEHTWTNPDGTTHKPAERFIGCDLLEFNNNCHGWGYKDMDESMHPHYYNCPEKYLNLVPEVACQDWREGVKEYHQRRRQKLAEKRKAG